MDLSQHSFEAVTRLFRDVSGIQLTSAKRSLVVGRLQKLAAERGAASLDEYVDELTRGTDAQELVRVVDRLTTNETYFFREPQHFRHLVDAVQRRNPAAEFRVWSAASSSGEEAYSIAMVLSDEIGPTGWTIVGTDLSSAMIDAARRGLYPLERTRNIRPEYLKRWCRKGTGDYDGQVLMARELRASVRFECANLMKPLPDIGRFDVIFLRNVLIYFDTPGKAAIVQRVLEHLKPDGVLFTGHAESITSLGLPLRATAPAVYVRS